MEDPNVSPHAVGSVLSALTGWAALIFAGFVGSLFQRSDEAYGFMFWAVVCAPFIFLVWLVALLPLYLCVPAHSMLWRRFVRQQGNCSDTDQPDWRIEFIRSRSCWKPKKRLPLTHKFQQERPG
jgi:hypothetical protein